MALESGSVDDIDTKTGIGYTIICLILTNTCFSMFFVVKEMILTFIEKAKENYKKIKEYCKKKHGKKNKSEDKYIVDEEIESPVKIILRSSKDNESEELRDSL